jgi:leucyl-tRNA synthetase
MAKYDPKSIEPKWQKKWLEEKVFRASDDSKKPKYYQLETFPYPSAAGLHVGHPKGYIAEDIHARYMRMRGYEVLYTMGWDAFGLPTENYAIKVGRSPREVAEENMKNFKRQVQMFGLSYDWDREISTSSPEYYKWTQWLFIQLFKKGLAYRAKAKVNWCPKDQTVLANEQVVSGKCERCGSEIEERDMEQWFLKITDYADRLLEGLKGLDWPAATIKRQKDWIGKSEGAEIKFAIRHSPFAIDVFTTRPDTLFGATYVVLAPEHDLITKLKPHIENWSEVEKYVDAAKHKTDLMRQEQVKEKTGIELGGVRAINPATKEEIPIWTADYVLGSYGTGAIMAVPAHDERDFEFAKKFGLIVQEVVIQETGIVHPNEERRDGGCGVVFDPKTQKYAVAARPNGPVGFFGGGVEDDEDSERGVLREITEESGLCDFDHVEKIRTCFAHYNNYRKQIRRSALAACFFVVLKSDARKEPKLEEHEKGLELAWMTPQEIIKNWSDHNADHSLDHWLIFLRESVARAIELGYDTTNKAADFSSEVFTGNGILINSDKFSGMDSETAKWEIAKFVRGERKTQFRLRDWSVSRQRYWGVPIPMIHCEKCGIVSVPENELPILLPDLKDYRPHGMPPLASSESFINVACPQCGGLAKRDSETLDTFVDSSWYYLRYTDPHNEKAIFDKKKAKHWLPVDLYVIGAEHTVLHLLYSRFITKLLYDNGWLNFEEPFLKLRHQGIIRGMDGQKMSKSKGNVVNPDEIVGEFGTDSVRLYEMFMGPFEDGQPWDTKGILGVERFLKKAWNYLEEIIKLHIQKKSPDVRTDSSKRSIIEKTIKKIGDDIENFRFNTAISSLMILFNGLYIEHIELAALGKEDLEKIIKILHPFAPHMAQELWSLLGHKSYLDFEPWPEYDPKLLVEDTVTIVLQVNGRVRDTIKMDASVTAEEARAAALANENVKRLMSSVPPKKIIYVDKKLVNIVLNP